MNDKRLDTVFVWLGAASVVVELAGTFVGFGAGRPGVTITSSTAAVAKAIAHPLAPIGWLGASLELLGTGMFLAFAVWVCVRLGGGVLGAVGQASAGASVTLSIASLGVLDVVEYREGHGLTVASASVLTKLNSGLFIASWIPMSFFLLSVGALALRAGRRRLGWSANAVAAATLAAVALSLVGNAGQMLALASLGWTLAASIALGRRAPDAPRVTAAAAAA